MVDVQVRHLDTTSRQLSDEAVCFAMYIYWLVALCRQAGCTGFHLHLSHIKLKNKGPTIHGCCEYCEGRCTCKRDGTPSVMYNRDGMRQFRALFQI
jgi:hypothetical protein